MRTTEVAFHAPTVDRRGGGSRRFALWLGVVGLAALGIRVGYTEIVARHIELGLDSVWYELVSGPLAHGQGYLNPGALFNHGVKVPTAGYPPLFPAFLALVTKLAGATTRDFRYAGAAMGTVTVVLVGLIGRRVGGNAVGIVAAVMAACYPALIAVDGSVMSETVYVPLVCGSVLVAYAAMDRPAVWRWALLGALLGAAALTRLDGVLLTLLLACCCAARLPACPTGRRVLLAGTTVAVAAVVVTPWVVRNDRRLGEPTLATISSAATVAGANCRTTYSGSMLGYWDFGCIQSRRQEALGEVAWSRQVQKAGISYARDHIGRLPLVAAVRELRVWGLYDPFHQARLESHESRRYGWQLLAWWVWLLVGTLGVGGFVVLVHARQRVVPMFAVVASVALTAVLTHGNQRFRAVAEPVLLVSAAAAVVRLAPLAFSRARDGA